MFHSYSADRQDDGDNATSCEVRTWHVLALIFAASDSMHYMAYRAQWFIIRWVVQVRRLCVYCLCLAYRILFSTHYIFIIVYCSTCYLQSVTSDLLHEIDSYFRYVTNFMSLVTCYMDHVTCGVQHMTGKWKTFGLCETFQWYLLQEMWCGT